jgi:hypothetical protein
MQEVIYAFTYMLLSLLIFYFFFKFQFWQPPFMAVYQWDRYPQAKGNDLKLIS